MRWKLRISAGSSLKELVAVPWHAEVRCRHYELPGRILFRHRYETAVQPAAERVDRTEQVVVVGDGRIEFGILSDQITEARSSTGGRHPSRVGAISPGSGGIMYGGSRTTN